MFQFRWEKIEWKYLEKRAEYDAQLEYTSYSRTKDEVDIQVDNASEVNALKSIIHQKLESILVQQILKIKQSSLQYAQEYLEEIYTQCVEQDRVLSLLCEEYGKDNQIKLKLQQELEIFLKQLVERYDEWEKRMVFWIS